VLELHGKSGPTSPRERNLLDIIALQALPLTSSYAVLDRTQSINRTGLRTDGLLPTFCKGSKFWALGLGHEIPESSIAALFGHTPKTDFHGLSPAQVGHLLGNSMHLADVGTVMALGVLIKAGLVA
jgi:hypothetical protein